MGMTVKNTDTGNDIKVSSALAYYNSKEPGKKAAYSAAVGLIKTNTNVSDKDINKLI